MRNSSITGEQLATSLRALGIKFIMGGKDTETVLRQTPVELIAALAQSREARLRLSLIPLFLEHPEFSAQVRAAAQGLPAVARLTLQCYYSAAVWLQKKHCEHLEKLLGTQPALPDLFSNDLSLRPSADPVENLKELAQRHQERSGETVNWLGTYQHAAQIWLRGLENQHA